MSEKIIPRRDDEPTPASADLAHHQPLAIIEQARQEQDPNNLERWILKSEEALGIRTTSARLVEASLAIDKKFIDVAVITGHPARPERIFGDKEWAGHLAARLLVRQYGNRPVTTDFIVALHQSYVDKIEPGNSSAIVDGGPWRGGQYIDGRHAPITCSNEQIAAINSNPLLRFDIDTESDAPNTGFIHYPTMSRQERRECLDKICARYNTDSQAADADPHRNAALLQRHAISLHPLASDFNGRTLRTLMNWALENAGESPSIVDDVDGDLFLSEEDWVESVRAGSERYDSYRDRAEAGETDPVALFGLEPERLRYEKLLGASGDSSPPLVGYGWHDHSLYEKFLAQLREVTWSREAS